jgi:hypothetical protein
VGVHTPTIDAEIKLASVIYKTNHWRTERMVKELGISGLSVEEPQKFADEGVYPQ